MGGVGNDGQPLDGWPHVEQSIAKILHTMYGTRVLRRQFGSELPDLVDRPMNRSMIMRLFAATAIALQPRQVGHITYGEPRFKLTRIELLEANAAGRIRLALHGDYLPNGHLGNTEYSETGKIATVAL